MPKAATAVPADLFRREAHVDAAGPTRRRCRGGDVWLVADFNQASLLGFRDTPPGATDGAHGRRRRSTVAAGPT